MRVMTYHDVSNDISYDVSYDVSYDISYDVSYDIIVISRPSSFRSSIFRINLFNSLLILQCRAGRANSGGPGRAGTLV